MNITEISSALSSKDIEDHFITNTAPLPDDKWLVINIDKGQGEFDSDFITIPSSCIYAASRRNKPDGDGDFLLLVAIEWENLYGCGLLCTKETEAGNFNSLSVHEMHPTPLLAAMSLTKYVSSQLPTVKRLFEGMGVHTHFEPQYIFLSASAIAALKLAELEDD